MKINTGRYNPPYHACRHLVSLCIDFLAGIGRITYFGTAYYHFSICHRTGYTDAYLLPSLLIIPFVLLAGKVAET